MGSGECRSLNLKHQINNIVSNLPSSPSRPLSNHFSFYFNLLLLSFLQGVVLAQFPNLKVASFEQCSDIVGDIQVVKYACVCLFAPAFFDHSFSSFILPIPASHRFFSLLRLFPIPFFRHPLEVGHLPHLEELRLSGCKRITGDVKVFRVGPPIPDADGFYDSGNHHFDRGQVTVVMG